jgi:hypothetical protein
MQIRDMFDNDMALVRANSALLCTQNVQVRCVPIQGHHLRGTGCDLLIVDEWECISQRDKLLLEPLLDVPNIKVLFMSRTIEGCGGGEGRIH